MVVLLNRFIKMANELSSHLPGLVGRRILTTGFENWLSQTNDIKIYTCRYLAWRSALLRYGKEQWNDEDLSFAIEISSI